MKKRVKTATAENKLELDRRFHMVVMCLQAASAILADSIELWLEHNRKGSDQDNEMRKRKMEMLNLSETVVAWVIVDVDFATRAGSCQLPRLHRHWRATTLTFCQVLGKLRSVL
jgi:hypothetical protein